VRKGNADNAQVAAAPAMNSLRNISSLRLIWDASEYTTLRRPDAKKQQKMSALGQKQTSENDRSMSALASKADLHRCAGMSEKCHLGES
jgi:hypothetical protein